MPWALWDKVIDFKDESVVQCDVPVVNNTSLDDDDDDNDETPNKFLWVYLIYCFSK